MEKYAPIECGNSQICPLSSFFIFGNNVRCSDLDVVTEAQVKSICKKHVGVLELEFKNKHQATSEDCRRLLNAFKHLAELDGAKVNQKEPFRED